MNPGPGIDMPLEGHKTHRNLLSTCPRQHRKLEMMFMLDENMFDAEIIHCELGLCTCYVELVSWAPASH